MKAMTLIMLMAIALIAEGMGFYSTLQYGQYKEQTNQEVRFGIHYKYKDIVEPYIEHIATLSHTENTRGLGLNVAGMNLYTPKYKGTALYGGGYAIPKRYNQLFNTLTGKEYGYRAGIKHNISDNASVYFENFNGQQNSIGVRWEQ